MSHNMFSDVREGGAGRLNNASALGGNAELPASIPALESLFSPLVGSGTTDY